MPSSLRSGRRLSENEDATSAADSETITELTLMELRQEMKLLHSRSDALAAENEALKRQIQHPPAGGNIANLPPADAALPGTSRPEATPAASASLPPITDTSREPSPPTHAAKRTDDWVRATQAEQMPPWAGAIVNTMQVLGERLLSVSTAPPTRPDVHTEQPRAIIEPPMAWSPPTVEEDSTRQWASAIVETMHTMSTALMKISAPTKNTEEEPGRMDKFMSRSGTSAVLKPFGGDPMEWAAFEAHYYQTTDLCQLSGVENQARLRLALHGKALDAVLSIINRADETVEIMAILKDAFGMPQSILRQAIEMIDNLPQMSKQTLPSEMLSFGHAAKNAANILQSCSTNDLSERALLRQLTSKMPQHHGNLWIEWGLRREERLGVKSQPSLREFSEWCSDFRDRASRSGMHEVEPRVQEVELQMRHAGTKLPRAKRATALATVGDSECESAPPAEPAARHHPATASVKKARASCALCEKVHQLSTCTVFLAKNVKDRHAVARKLKLCFRCLVPWHNNHECGKKCPLCSGAHHRELHRDHGIVASA